MKGLSGDLDRLKVELIQEINTGDVCMKSLIEKSLKKNLCLLCFMSIWLSIAQAGIIMSGYFSRKS